MEALDRCNDLLRLTSEITRGLSKLQRDQLLHGGGKQLLVLLRQVVKVLLHHCDGRLAVFNALAGGITYLHG